MGEFLQTINVFKNIFFQNHMAIEMLSIKKMFSKYAQIMIPEVGYVTF